MTIGTAWFLLATLLPLSANECPPAARAAGPGAVALDIERTARRARGDACPDRAAPTTPAAESELLDQIRTRTLPRLSRAAAAARDVDPSVAFDQFKAMRLRLAARRADVTLQHGRFVITPDLKSAHPGNFAALTVLRPEENAEVQRAHAERLRSANERAAGQSKQMVGRIGADLRDEIRREGERGYHELIAANPSLLYVERDRDVVAARDRYLAELAAETAELPKLKLNPPGDDALALVFYEGPVAETLRARPELCGAFRELKSRARRSRRLAGVVRAGVDAVTSEALCGLVTSLTNVAGLAFCVGQVAVKVGAPGLVPGWRTQERQALYGGF